MAIVPRVLFVGFLAAASVVLPAQQRAPQMPPPVDPYTQAGPAAMAAAGYVSFGPFPFGNNHDSAEIDALLPHEPLLWIETAHFRIGCALAPREVGKDKAWVGKLRAELEQLAQRLPRIDPDAKRLDGWLRAHLVAQRAEQVYADVLRRLGRSTADFEAPTGHDPRAPRAFRGFGPYLGLPQKFTVLLVQRSASLAKYTAAHHGWANRRPTRFHDHKFGCAFFGAAEESDGGLLADDEALRTHLTFHVAHNLYTSYRSYGHNLPAWIVNGLAHGHARQVSTRFPVYALGHGPGSAPKDYLAWSERWPQMLKNGQFEALPTFVERMDVDAYSMDDHLQCWALVDWLMAARRSETMLFFERMKDPFHERLRFPTDGELFLRQREAMREAFGTDAAGLEAAWRTYRPTKVASR